MGVGKESGKGPNRSRKQTANITIGPLFISWDNLVLPPTPNNPTSVLLRSHFCKEKGVCSSCPRKYPKAAGFKANPNPHDLKGVNPCLFKFILVPVRVPLNMFSPNLI